MCVYISALEEAETLNTWLLRCQMRIRTCMEIIRTYQPNQKFRNWAFQRVHEVEMKFQAQQKLPNRKSRAVTATGRTGLIRQASPGHCRCRSCGPNLQSVQLLRAAKSALQSADTHQNALPGLNIRNLGAGEV